MAIERCLRRVQRFSLSEMKGFDLPLLITRATNDVQQIQMVLVMGLNVMVLAPSMAMQIKVDRVNQLMREKLAGVRAVRAFVRRTHEERRFDGANRNLIEITFSLSCLVVAVAGGRCPSGPGATRYFVFTTESPPFRMGASPWSKSNA